MKLKGYTADEICKMTGHTDDKMVREVYGHYGVEDEIKKLKEATARINGKNNTRNDYKKNYSHRICFWVQQIDAIERLTRK